MLGAVLVRASGKGIAKMKHVLLSALAAALVCAPALAQAAPCAEPNSIVNVRNTTARHFDYVIFKYQQPPNLPSYAVTAATPPFTQDGSGDPVHVSGAKFTQVRFEGVVWTCGVTEQFHLPRAAIKDIKSLGQFEGVITYSIGRRARSHYVSAITRPAGAGFREIVVKYRK